MDDYTTIKVALEYIVDADVRTGAELALERLHTAVEKGLPAYIQREIDADKKPR